MRKDLMHWEQALQLANTLSPAHVPDICVRYGQQLEFHEEFESAFRMFEAALGERDEQGNARCPEALVPDARKGLVRCNIRLGNTRVGLKQAHEIQDTQLYADCAEILEEQKQYAEAAAMYIKGEKYEAAADLYTKHLIKADKSKIAEAAEIMEKVQNDQLNASFAKVGWPAWKHPRPRASRQLNFLPLPLTFAQVGVTITVWGPTHVGAVRDVM